MFENLTNDNYLLYAIKAYDKPNCITSEFKDDMKRFNYLKRLFRRYVKLNELREQLVLNHIIVLNNVFGPKVCCRLLFFKMPKEYYSALKTYLMSVNIMQDIVTGIKGKDIISSEIQVDMKIAEGLRKILKHE